MPAAQEAKNEVRGECRVLRAWDPGKPAAAPEAKQDEVSPEACALRLRSQAGQICARVGFAFGRGGFLQSVCVGGKCNVPCRSLAMNESVCPPQVCREGSRITALKLKVGAIPFPYPIDPQLCTMKELSYQPDAAIFAASTL